jgi:CDI immunity proteins
MSAAAFDRTKTLDELDPPAWGPPTYSSYLVTTCHRLRTKPLNEFDEEDLRIMIGQKISLEYLMPLALEVLEQDPIASGDFYQGDLLQSVLRVDTAWWASHPDQLVAVRSVVVRLDDPLIQERVDGPLDLLRPEIEAFHRNTAGILVQSHGRETP